MEKYSWTTISTLLTSLLGGDESGFIPRLKQLLDTDRESVINNSASADYVLRFGKHKGKTLGEMFIADPGYLLNWCMSKLDTLTGDTPDTVYVPNLNVQNNISFNEVVTVPIIPSMFMSGGSLYFLGSAGTITQIALP